MNAILFVDLLGTRQRWQTGGIPGVTNAFNHFARMVVAAIKKVTSGQILDGGIETDSAILVCDSALTALNIAKCLYTWAFRNPRRPDAPRLWLRGSIVPVEKKCIIRRESIIKTPLNNIKVCTYSPTALDAISVEKSGFKGMRLLVRKEIVDSETQNALRFPYKGYSFIPIRHLRHITYPKIVEGELLDFLWMATMNDDEWYDISIHMTSRLRHSAKNAEEFAQAAATQVVFHECAAIIQSVKSRAERALRKQNGKSK